MEQPNLNVRHHRWLVVVKDYHCEIIYHARKAKVVADAISLKANSTPIKDVYLRMISPLLDQIHEAQVEAMNDEHQKCKCIVGHMSSFDYDI